MSTLAGGRGFFGCLFVAAALAGCADRVVGDSETEGSSSAGTTTTGETPTTAVDPSSPATSETTVPGTTATTVSTSTSTTSPTSATTVTSDVPDPTTTSDPSGPDTATTIDEPKLDVGTRSVPGGIVSGCTKDPPGLTAIQGESALGQMVVSRAYFGYFFNGSTLGGVRLLFLDDTADVDVAFAELAQDFGEIMTGPGAGVSPSLQFNEQDPFWMGIDEQTAFAVRAAGEGTAVVASVHIVGHEGNWDELSPGDPARLLGKVGPGGEQFAFAGEFDAVFCDLLNVEVIPE